MVSLELSNYGIGLLNRATFNGAVTLHPEGLAFDYIGMIIIVFIFIIAYFAGRQLS